MTVKTSNSILKITAPSQTEFLNKWRQYQPFVIDGVAENWDACKNWSNDYLIKHSGNNKVVVRFFKKTFLEDYKEFTCMNPSNEVQIQKKMIYKEYIDNYINGGNKNNEELAFYLGSNVHLEEFFPEIVKDVNYPDYLNRKGFVGFWHGLSSENFSSTTPLHFDPFHNIIVQIRGRKRILLFPPSNYLSFYPPVDDNEFGHGIADFTFSKVNPDRPNLELFPNFPWQERIEVILQPGEMLYIPPCWWHHVTAVGENISLSSFYDIKIQDFFRQKKLLSTFVDILPRYLYHGMSHPKEYLIGMFLMFIKSIIP